MAATPRDLLDAGATLVAVGTENFRDPAAAGRIARELEHFLANCAMIAGPSQRLHDTVSKNTCKVTKIVKWGEPRSTSTRG